MKVTLALVLLCVTLIFEPCLAVTTIWNNNALTSADWFAPENWSNGVPTANDDAVFQPEDLLSVRVNGDAVARSVTVGTGDPNQSFSFALIVTGSFRVGNGGLR